MKDGSRFFKVIAQEAIMGIMAFDPGTGVCQYINGMGRELLEIGSEEAGDEIPLTLADLFPDGSSRAGLARPMTREMLNNEGLFQDVLVKKLNGHIIIANVGVKHVQLEDKSTALLLMVQDITIQKKLQREIQVKQEEIHKAFTELIEQNRQLRDLDVAKDRFIALTTHELRTPLAAIVATAEVLELKLYEDESQRDGFVKTIYEQGLQLMQLVNDILDFAKIRAGKMELYVEEVDLVPQLGKIMRNFAQMAGQCDVTMSIDEVEGPIMAYTDLLRLKEVANNVINNAIKYNRPGGSVTIGFERFEDFVRVKVTDTGPGIPESKIGHVFNEFETAGTVSRHHKGTGLGMPISKRLMLAMGGDLSLESTEGVGTTFFIDLPNKKVLDESLYRTRTDDWGDLAA